MNGGELSETYEYDGLSRLRTMLRGGMNANHQLTSGPASPVMGAAEWVEMDLRGNWASYREYVENAEERDWTYGETRTHDPANAIDTRMRDFDGPNGAGGGSGAPESFGTEYDLRGNLTGDAVHGYGYDEENRLTAVCRLDSQGEDCDTEVAELEIEYDALGRVVRRTVVIGPNERTFRYVYDGLSYAVIQEWEDGIGAGGAAGLLREFVYAGSHIEPVTMIDYTDGGYRSAGQAESLHYLRDERNCVVALVSEYGVVLESYRYDPYGRTYLWLGQPDGPPDRVWTDDAWTAATGSFRPNPLSPSYVGNPFGFTGHRFSAAGLFETPFRVYSPELGRWLQRDPIGYIDGANVFAYVISAPMRYLDSMGLAVYLRWHRIPGTPYDHTSIWIVPDDQYRYEKDPRFIGAAMGMSATISAGPIDGKLHSDTNRPSDIGYQDGKILIPTPSQYKDENEFIEALLGADSVYNDGLDYDCFPHYPEDRWLLRRDDGYNSNSFVSGLLDVVGASKPTPPGKVPGWDVPVPPSKFWDPPRWPKPLPAEPAPQPAEPSPTGPDTQPHDGDPNDECEGE